MRSKHLVTKNLAARAEGMPKKWLLVWAGDENKAICPNSDSNGAGSNGGWIQPSPDDKYLYRAIVGRQKGTLSADDTIEEVQGRVDTNAKAQQGGAATCRPSSARPRSTPARRARPASGRLRQT
ncbi:hypothetical protein OG439_42090 [Amycolatopsis sp. NBC_01307]|nr:hypothetical protein OG439_42090 [Amycolatopsis sp. NBC_01307]